MIFAVIILVFVVGEAIMIIPDRIPIIRAIRKRVKK